MPFLYDLGVNVLAGLIGFILGIPATIYLIEPALEKRRLARAMPLIGGAIEYELLEPLGELRNRSILVAKSEQARLPDRMLQNAVEAIDRFIEKFGTRTPDDINNVLIIIRYVAETGQKMLSKIETRDAERLAERELAFGLANDISLLLETLAEDHVLPSYRVSEECPGCRGKLEVSTSGRLYCQRCQTSHSFREILVKEAGSFLDQDLRSGKPKQ
jgi:hypothetical protein